MSKRSADEWVREYSAAHQNAANRACHMVGIPLIVISPLMLLAEIWAPALDGGFTVVFAAGWILQFVGHAFEGKPPEFLRDWRFVFVGVQWWFAKITGKA
jgi:uncharacterized membrane protein YGL010W